MSLREEIESYINVMAREVECDRVFINLKDGPFLSSMGVPNLDASKSVRVHKLQDTLCAVTLGSSKPVSIENAPSEAEFNTVPYVESGIIVGYLGVPICIKDIGAVGTVCAISGKPRVWESRERELLSVLALAVAMSIELDILRCEADGLSDGLLENDTLLVVLAECLDQPVAVIDGQYNVTFVSRQLAAFLEMEDVAASAKDLVQQYSMRRHNVDDPEHHVECECAGRKVAVSLTSSGDYFCKWDMQSQLLS